MERSRFSCTASPIIPDDDDEKEEEMVLKKANFLCPFSFLFFQSLLHDGEEKFIVYSLTHLYGNFLIVIF